MKKYYKTQVSFQEDKEKNRDRVQKTSTQRNKTKES